jgi:CubicO group peptidase (beta-lactamase class C family)
MDRRHFVALTAVALVPPSGLKAQTLPQLLAGGDTSAMLVLKGGEPVFSYGNLAEPSYVASVRKSLVSMLYGPAVATGAIRLDRTLDEMKFDDKDGLLPVERTATIRDLLTARSGVYHKAANEGDASDRAPARGSVKPGSHFLYNNWDFNALGTIYERQTGRDFYRAFAEDIAGPAGLQDFNVALHQTQAIRNDTGLSDHPARHFVLSTRDMAALGQVMLRKGNRQGRQVIAEDWVARTTATVTPAPEVARTSSFLDGLGYGWLWWTFDGANWPADLKGAYSATGAFGQFITIVPALDLVVAHKVVAPSQRNVPPQTYFASILPSALALARK